MEDQKFTKAQRNRRRKKKARAARFLKFKNKLKADGKPVFDSQPIQLSKATDNNFIPSQRSTSSMSSDYVLKLDSELESMIEDVKMDIDRVLYHKLIEEAKFLLEDKRYVPHEVINVFPIAMKPGYLEVQVKGADNKVRKYTVPSDAYHLGLKKHIVGKLRSDSTKIGKVFKIGAFYEVLRNLGIKSDNSNDQMELGFES